MIATVFPTERAPVTEDLTFARDIAPLVHRRCSSCHHTGGSGPFPLVTYRDVQRRLRQIQIVTTERFMPPWPPVPGHGESTSAGSRMRS